MRNHSLKEICKFNKTDDYDSFVGLRIVNHLPMIYLPLGYNTDEDITCGDIDHLITAIKRYSKRTNVSHNINNDFQNEDKFPYFAYKWLIEDYLEHGYYNELEYLEEKGLLGKINWKRTISKPSEIMTKNGPIYTNFIIRKSKTNENNLLTRIHEFCIYESYQKLGWLFDPKNSVKRPLLIIDTDNKNKYLSILNEELKKTFQDYKKELIKNMIHLITGLDDMKQKKLSLECGTTKFYHVWEKMIDKAYSNISNIEQYYPHGEWHISNNTVKNSALQPDTIIRLKNEVYIYDSKYYTYCNTNSITHLPTTDSIQKQITYAEYIHKKFNVKTIYNVFVMPGMIKEKLKYVGYATADWKDNDKSFHKIYTYMLDTKFMINNYNKKPFDYIRNELSTINEYNNLS